MRTAHNTIVFVQHVWGITCIFAIISLPQLLYPEHLQHLSPRWVDSFTDLFCALWKYQAYCLLSMYTCLALLQI